MSYHDYLTTFSKEDTVNKSDEDKNLLFNELVEYMANHIVDSSLVG